MNEFAKLLTSRDEAVFDSAHRRANQLSDLFSCVVQTVLEHKYFAALIRKSCEICGQPLWSLVVEMLVVGRGCDIVNLDRASQSPRATLLASKAQNRAGRNSIRPALKSCPLCVGMRGFQHFNQCILSCIVCIWVA